MSISDVRGEYLILILVECVCEALTLFIDKVNDSERMMIRATILLTAQLSCHSSPHTAGHDT